MNIRKKSAVMIGRKMKKSIISLAMALIFLLPCSYGLVINEDGQTLSEASGLKEGDRIILPDGSMYRMVQKEELTARLDEILPEISEEDTLGRMYRYKRIGVYGINREIEDVSQALKEYGAVTLNNEKELSAQEKAQKLSYSGAALLLGVASAPGKEIRLRVWRTVSQKDSMLIARRAMNKGSISCLIIQNPPAGQSLAQPRIILEIGQDAASGQVLKALADIGGALFDEAMQPDGSAQASLYIAPVCLGLIFICFVCSFFRP